MTADAEFTVRYRMVVAVGLLIGLYAVQSMAPPSIARLPFVDSIEVRMVLPEAWQFFTRSPRDPLVEAFRFDGDRLDRIGGRLSDVGPFRSFSRARRVVGLEFELIAAKMSSASWSDCTSPLADCAQELGAPIPVALTGVDHVCGDVVLSRTEPVPWSWFAKGDPVAERRQLARARVSCGHEGE